MDHQKEAVADVWRRPSVKMIPLLVLGGLSFYKLRKLRGYKQKSMAIVTCLSITSTMT